MCIRHYNSHLCACQVSYTRYLTRFGNLCKLRRSFDRSLVCGGLLSRGLLLVLLEQYCWFRFIVCHLKAVSLLFSYTRWVSADNGFLAFDSRIYGNEHRFPFYLYVYLYCITEMETIVRYLQREYWRQDQVRFQLGHSYKITVKFETNYPSDSHALCLEPR